MILVKISNEIISILSVNIFNLFLFESITM